jgi:glyoxylate utilization-related uncharacterized protein
MEQQDLPPAPRRSGAVAYKSDNEWVVACPGDSLFSVATFCATHYYVEGEGWKRIWEEE